MGVSYSGKVDFDALPDDIRARANDVLCQENLIKLTHPQPSVNYSGAMAYELRYQGSDAVFLIRDDQASAEFIEVMDELADYLTVSPVE